MDEFEKYKNKFAYHFTSLDNLKSIAKHGLLSTNKKNDFGLGHVDVSERSIQDRRHQMRVTCDPQGCVHDYVPFYFSQKTSMQLSVINKRNVDQQHLVYFAVSLQNINCDDVVFSDSSANADCPPNFYNSTSDIGKLDWSIIESKKWGGFSEQEKQQKMAEMLVYNQCPLSRVDYIIVWNDYVKRKVESTFEEAGLTNWPAIRFDDNHYYLRYFDSGKERRMSIISGPVFLYAKVRETVKLIIQEKPSSGYKFQSIDEALKKIKSDFSCIKELEGIEGLKTDNVYSCQDIGEHSRTVSRLLSSVDEFLGLSERNQQILKLSAYLHDIGKKGVQRTDGEHPRKSLPMLKRILIEDIGGLSNSEIYLIVILVVYDDLVAEIVANDRDSSQLHKLIRNETDVNMLISITKADMKSINPSWELFYHEKVELLKSKALQSLET